MASFSNKNKQALNVMKELSRHIKSCGTNRNIKAALTNVADWAIYTRINGLKNITKVQAIQYLMMRSEELQQSSLDIERQAIELMMIKVTKKLKQNEKLPIIKSELETIVNCRAYSFEQTISIASKQKKKNALATLISVNCGVRAHELFTLRPISKAILSARPYRDDLFLGRDSSKYSIYAVTGKGGLIRAVSIDDELVQLLEELQFEQPIEFTDRDIHYDCYYGVGGGKNWSSSFNQMSNKLCGFSNGAHGLRHSYAQKRMEQLLEFTHLTFDDRLEIVSQELGHFRPEITLVYLRANKKSSL